MQKRVIRRQNTNGRCQQTVVGRRDCLILWQTGAREDRGTTIVLGSNVTERFRLEASDHGDVVHVMPVRYSHLPIWLTNKDLLYMAVPTHRLLLRQMRATLPRILVQWLGFHQIASILARVVNCSFLFPSLGSCKNVSTPYPSKLWISKLPAQYSA